MRDRARVFGPWLVAVIFFCLALGRTGGERGAYIGISVVFMILGLRRSRSG